MTKTIAFLIGYFAPVVVWGAVWLYLSSFNGLDILNGLYTVWLFLIPLLLTSFFIPALFLHFFAGEEFRKYGFYGSLISLLSSLLLIFLPVLLRK